MRVIDCALRDGGYYTDWHFHPTLVNAYVDAMYQSGIRDVEVGFRFAKEDKTLGAFAYSTDEFISNLLISPDVRVGVMVNASDFMDGSRFDVKGINPLFSPAMASPVCFVRIAVRVEKVMAAVELCSVLISLGYSVHLNLMRMSELGRDSEGWETLSRADITGFETITLADSFGEMLTADILPMMQRFRSLTDSVLRVQMHDNMGLALANTIASIEAGVGSVDATVAGIGRGAGNVKTEEIAALLPTILPNGDGEGLDVNRLNAFSSEFQEGYSSLLWGPNIYYNMGAVSGIHPTYIQRLCDGAVDEQRILAAVLFLGESGAAVFS